MWGGGGQCTICGMLVFNLDSLGEMSDDERTSRMTEPGHQMTGKGQSSTMIHARKPQSIPSPCDLRRLPVLPTPPFPLILKRNPIPAIPSTITPTITSTVSSSTISSIIPVAPILIAVSIVAVFLFSSHLLLHGPPLTRLPFRASTSTRLHIRQHANLRQTGITWLARWARFRPCRKREGKVPEAALIVVAVVIVMICWFVGGFGVFRVAGTAEMGASAVVCG